MFPPWISVEESVCNAGTSGDVGSVPGLGRSPGRGNGNPLLFLPDKNLRDRGAWWAIAHGVTNSRAWLSTQAGAQSLLCCESFLKTQDPIICFWFSPLYLYIYIFIYVFKLMYSLYCILPCIKLCVQISLSH